MASDRSGGNSWVAEPAHWESRLTNRCQSQFLLPCQPRNLIAIAAASLSVPASVSSSLSSTRDTLVSRMPLLVIRFHIYKKKNYYFKNISRHQVANPTWRRNFSTNYSSSMKRILRSKHLDLQIIRQHSRIHDDMGFHILHRQHPP